MLFIISAIHILICLFLIMVVLLQQGSGADLSVFGGGGTQTAFGARTATNLLHRLTVAGFVGFILTTIAIGFLKTGGSAGSIMSGVGQEAPAAAGEIEAEVGAEAPAPASEAPVSEEPAASFEEPVEEPAAEESTADEPSGGS